MVFEGVGVSVSGVCEKPLGDSVLFGFLGLNLNHCTVNAAPKHRIRRGAFKNALLSCGCGA